MSVYNLDNQDIMITTALEAAAWPLRERMKDVGEVHNEHCIRLAMQMSFRILNALKVMDECKYAVLLSEPTANRHFYGISKDLHKMNREGGLSDP